jgi:hypothetical protein
MINQKRGLLSRVRIVLTALVMLTGIGTTLMAMKPVTTYKYTVAETAGNNWRVIENVSNQSYICNPSSSICSVSYEQNLDPGELIPQDSVTVYELGEFIPD